MKIYVVRHGETNWNKEKLLQGQTNTSLNETGVKQAYEVKQKLKNIKLDVIISSTLKRAKQTAKIINEDRKCKIIFDDRINERNYGKLEGTSPKREDMLIYWKLNVPFPEEHGIEAIDDFLNRIKAVLNDIKNKYESVLLVTHAGTYRAIEHYFSQDKEESLIKNLDNGEIKCFEIT